MTVKIARTFLERLFGLLWLDRLTIDQALYFPEPQVTQLAMHSNTLLFAQEKPWYQGENIFTALIK